MSGWAWIFTFSRSNTRENRHPRRLLGTGIFPPPTLQPSVYSPLLALFHPSPPLTSDDSTHCARCAATESPQSSLDCARGLLWWSTTTTPRVVRPLSPADNPVGGGQESVTPTFQVDDLHCIRRCARTPRPSPRHRPPPLPPATPVRGWRSAAAAAAGREEEGEGREERTNPTVACHYLRLKIVWLVTVNLWGGGRSCILIALSLCFSFLPSSLSFFLRGDEMRLASGMKLWNRSNSFLRSWKGSKRLDYYMVYFEFLELEILFLQIFYQECFFNNLSIGIMRNVKWTRDSRRIFVWKKETCRSEKYNSRSSRWTSGILDGFRWYPSIEEDFRGAPAGRRNRQVWKKFILSSGFADPVTAGHERCIYAYAPDADKGLLTPSCLHPHMETRSRLLHGRCSTLPLSLSFSLSLLAPFLPLPWFPSLSVPPPSSPSVCSISRSQRILESAASFESSPSIPHRIHPASGEHIIHCTAR